MERCYGRVEHVVRNSCVMVQSGVGRSLIPTSEMCCSLQDVDKLRPGDWVEFLPETRDGKRIGRQAIILGRDPRSESERIPDDYRETCEVVSTRLEKGFFFVQSQKYGRVFCHEMNVAPGFSDRLSNVFPGSWVYLGVELLGKNVRGTNIEIFSSEELQAFQDQLAETPPLEDLVDSRIENNVVPRTSPPMPTFDPEPAPPPIVAEPKISEQISEQPANSVTRDPILRNMSIADIIRSKRRNHVSLRH